MDHNLFKPKNLNEGKHGVVGNCNGITMEDRYREETPVFAKKILSLCEAFDSQDEYLILDYGCGVGRLLKEVRQQSDKASLWGVDASPDMIKLAMENKGELTNIRLSDPKNLVDTERRFDLAYLVYVLQHIPAIEIREALQRIHYHLKDNGILFYCSSDYRMAIRYDNKGFFDDRFLGVNLQEEISRYFDLVGPAFTDEELSQNKIVETMIKGNGGLSHPALVYVKKKIDGPTFNATNEVPKNFCYAPMTPPPVSVPEGAKQKLVLVQKQSPGDIMMATVALRDLHEAYPDQYITDMRTPCNDIFTNNPYVTSIPIEDKKREHDIIEELKADDKHAPIMHGDVMFCNLHYPMIHQSGVRGTHFTDAMTEFLSDKLGKPIPRTGLRPAIYLNQDEENWPSPVVAETGYDEPYWVINAGSKSDYPLKQYPYYQKVVDLLKECVKFVQVGVKSHNHKPLDGVIDMIGKTNLRQLFRVIYKAQGVLSCVSVHMHVAAAFAVPCVVVAGGREGTRWELYPDHRFLYTNGALDCCRYDGCWKNSIDQCAHVVDDTPLCLKMIKPEMVADAINMYYEGGVIK